MQGRPRPADPRPPPLRRQSRRVGLPAGRLPGPARPRGRRALLPPAEFWDAATRFADPGELPALASAAEARGLLRDAARLRKHAAARGDTEAAALLIRLLHSLHPADQDPAQWAAAHAAFDDPYDVADLVDALQLAGAKDQAAALAVRAAPSAVARLLGRAGAGDQAAALLARDPAAHAALDDPAAVARLLDALWELWWTGGEDQVAALLARDPAAHAILDDPSAVAGLLVALRRVGAGDQVAALLARDPAAHAALDNSSAVARLLDALRNADAEGQVSTLRDRLPAEGLFNLFCEQINHRVLYRFGREPNGTPAPSWGWDDLN